MPSSLIMYDNQKNYGTRWILFSTHRNPNRCRITFRQLKTSSTFLTRKSKRSAKKQVKVWPQRFFLQQRQHSVGFQLYTEDDVAKVITAAPLKSCELDTIPTDILKQFLPVLLSYITKMCNASLQRGTLPTTQRSAIVAPRLKKTGFDPADVRNYRPINIQPDIYVQSCRAYGLSSTRRLRGTERSSYRLTVCLQALSVDRDWRSQGRRWPLYSSGYRRSYTSQSARSIRCFWHG